MTRQEQILQIIVESYIATATPVSSGLVVEKYLSDVSSATVRNEMMDLEAQGLVAAPHTSAGRIPTTAGYQYYLEQLLPEIAIESAHREQLTQATSGAQANERVKNLAKALAEIADCAVLVGFGPMDVYYTGISNLFRQPEFGDHTQVYSISAVIDHLDEVMARVFTDVGTDIKVMIGETNPFGAMCSVVLTKFDQPNYPGLIGILGPSRMNYAANIELVKLSQKLLQQS